MNRNERSHWVIKSRNQNFQHENVSRYFQKIDVDNSGELEKIEVYTGVLVLYTMIIAYVPIATPPKRGGRLHRFDEADADNSGLLNAQEFQNVATILCCEVTSRLIKQMLFYLAFLPFLVSTLITALDEFITAPSFVPGTVVTVVMKIRQPAMVGICGALILLMIDEIVPVQTSSI